MGYFSNGCEGIDYQEKYCLHCINYENYGCAVWDAHLFYNYDECNNKKSILHYLIPRNKKTGENEKCLMFKLKINNGKRK